ncbi:MAG TPA: hypothetical protein VFW95_07130 [Candidatus Limnocylindria bacterium]|nr:hypothetical protein [Candidatus Limnocylindria bacterium]
MSERKPGEDLGIGWGVAEDPQTDAMGVDDARNWQEEGAPEAVADREGAGDESDEARDATRDDQG